MSTERGRDEASARAREIEARLRPMGTQDRRDFMARTMTTSMEALGVAVPDLRPVVKDAARGLKKAPPEQVLALGRALIRGGTFEGRQVAYELLAGHRATLSGITREQVLELGQGMDNWCSVDTWATLIAGPAWRTGRLPDADVEDWIRTGDRWWRRAAVVCTVALNQKARGGSGDVPRTLRTCEMVVADHDDMVVKALSWALRELSKRDPAAVVGFLDEHDTVLASRVKREVGAKLRTGLKNPR